MFPDLYQHAQLMYQQIFAFLDHEIQYALIVFPLCNTSLEVEHLVVFSPFT